MEAFIRFSILTDEKNERKIKKILLDLSISYEEPKRFIDGKIRFFIMVPLKKLELIYALRRKLPQAGIRKFGERFLYKFSNEEYEQAPLFVLSSTGNSPKAFLESNTKYRKVKICDVCGYETKVQKSELIIDTSKIGKRYMVNVDMQHWVINEAMAELLEKWNISGYELKPIIHEGPKNKQQPAYQLLSTHILPKWSSETKFIKKKSGEYCDACCLRGMYRFPIHYDQSSLDNLKDVNAPSNWSTNGQFAIRNLLFSKRLRELLIDHGITKNIPNPNWPDNYKKIGSYDWTFIPIIVV